MRKIVYFSIINGENRSLYERVTKSIKIWNHGFSKGYTPDPRLRRNIDENVTNYHIKTSSKTKIAVLDGFKNNLVTFLNDCPPYATTIDSSFIEQILAKIDQFLIADKNIKLETSMVNIYEWLNKHIGQELFIYKTNYDGKDHNRVIQKIKSLINKETLTKEEKLILLDCYKHFDNIFDLKMTDYERKILMTPILKEMDIAIDSNKEIWHTLYSLLRYSDDFENNRLIWDNYVAQNDKLQELRETILDNDNNGRTVFSTVNGKKFLFLRNGKYIQSKKFVKLLKQNPTKEFLDFFLSISYYYGDSFDLKAKKQIRKTIEQNNINIEITSPIILEYFSRIMNDTQ